MVLLIVAAIVAYVILFMLFLFKMPKWIKVLLCWLE